ncbi:MAG: hypothetical protein AAGH79_04980, partial [Bacteroidota bacterium]
HVSEQDETAATRKTIMGGLFGGGGSRVEYEEPEPPATMPDEGDALAMRRRRQRQSRLDKGSSAAADRLAPVPGTIGREFTRQTLGAS